MEAPWTDDVTAIRLHLDAGAELIVTEVGHVNASGVLNVEVLPTSARLDGCCGPHLSQGGYRPTATGIHVNHHYAALRTRRNAIAGETAPGLNGRHVGGGQVLRPPREALSGFLGPFDEGEHAQAEQGALNGGGPGHQSGIITRGG